MAFEGSAFVFSLFLSFEVSVKSNLLAEELLRRDLWDEVLIAVRARGRVSKGCGEIGGDMVVMVPTITNR
jgi:hypothetical protein